MEVFGVLPDLTLLHVVLLRVLEALLKVSLHLLEERIAAAVQPSLDIVESYWTLDLVVIVGVLSFRR